MSRRTRKRREVTGGTGWFGKTLIGLIVVSMVGAAILYAVVRGYLHGERFREFLAQKAGARLQVEGRFSPFRWDGLAVESSQFDGTGKGLVKELRVDGLHTEVGLGGISRGVWEIMGSRVQRMEVLVDASTGGGDSAVPVGGMDLSSSPEAGQSAGWLPTKVELQGIDVGDLNVRLLTKQGEFQVKGVTARLEPVSRQKARLLEISGGKIRLPFSFLPEVRMNRAKMRYQDGDVFLSHAGARVWETGRLDASGEWNSRSGLYTVEGELTGAKCENVFNEDWAKRFTGDIRTDFTVDNHAGFSAARGKLEITNGTLTALPILDSLAAYADTRRFRVIPLNESSADWSWKDGELVLDHLVMSSEGLIRLEGRMVVRGENLDGVFRLGLPPGTLASIPGAETDVFLPGERGFVWAPLRVSGTLDEPKEDLTGRLMAAAGIRMFDVIPETGEKVIKFTRTVVRDAPEKVIDTGAKVIETGAGIVEEVGGVLGGILGGGKKKPDPAPEPPPKPGP